MRGFFFYLSVRTSVYWKQRRRNDSAFTMQEDVAVTGLTVALVTKKRQGRYMRLKNWLHEIIRM